MQPEEGRRCEQPLPETMQKERWCSNEEVTGRALSCRILTFCARIWQMRRDPKENAQGFHQIAAYQGGDFSAAQAREAGYNYSQQYYHRPDHPAR
jgi:hypothetical protein